MCVCVCVGVGGVVLVCDGVWRGGCGVWCLSMCLSVWVWVVEYVGVWVWVVECLIMWMCGCLSMCV